MHYVYLTEHLSQTASINETEQNDVIRTISKLDAKDTFTLMADTQARFPMSLLSIAKTAKCKIQTVEVPDVGHMLSVGFAIGMLYKNVPDDMTIIRIESDDAKAGFLALIDACENLNHKDAGRKKQYRFFVQTPDEFIGKTNKKKPSGTKRTTPSSSGKKTGLKVFITDGQPAQITESADLVKESAGENKRKASDNDAFMKALKPIEHELPDVSMFADRIMEAVINSDEAVITFPMRLRLHVGTRFDDFLPLFQEHFNDLKKACE